MDTSNWFIALFLAIFAAVRKSKWLALLALSLATSIAFGPAIYRTVTSSEHVDDRYCPKAPELKATMDDLRANYSMALLMSIKYDKRYDEPYEEPLCQSTEPGRFPLPITKYFIPATDRGITDFQTYSSGKCLLRSFEGTETWALSCPIMLDGEYRYRLSLQDEDKATLPANLDKQVLQLTPLLVKRAQ